MVFGRISADSGKTLARRTKYSPTGKMRFRQGYFKGPGSVSGQPLADSHLDSPNYQKILENLSEKRFCRSSRVACMTLNRGQSSNRRGCTAKNKITGVFARSAKTGLITAVAAVHGDHRAAHVAGTLRGHEDDDVGHFLYRGGATRGQVGQITRPSIGIAELRFGA